MFSWGKSGFKVSLSPGRVNFQCFFFLRGKVGIIVSFFLRDEGRLYSKYLEGEWLYVILSLDSAWRNICYSWSFPICEVVIPVSPRGRVCIEWAVLLRKRG